MRSKRFFSSARFACREEGALYNELTQGAGGVNPAGHRSGSAYRSLTTGLCMVAPTGVRRNGRRSARRSPGAEHHLEQHDELGPIVYVNEPAWGKNIVGATPVDNIERLGEQHRAGNNIVWGNGLVALWIAPASWVRLADDPRSSCGHLQGAEMSIGSAVTSSGGFEGTWRGCNGDHAVRRLPDRSVRERRVCAWRARVSPRCRRSPRPALFVRCSHRGDQFRDEG
jgi:hypothetical protein